MQEMELRFQAGIDYESFIKLYTLRLEDLKVQIPSALDQWFIENGRNSQEKKLAVLSNEFREKSIDRYQLEILEADSQISTLQAKLSKKTTKTAQSSLDAKTRKRERLQAKISEIKSDKQSARIFPMSYAPLIVEQNGKRQIIMARYQVASEFESFNARRDSLQKKTTWRPLFGKSHGLLVFTRFFEWVQHDGKKIMISFQPKGHDIMWAPCMYKRHENVGPDAFAMITDDPPPEVLQAGHDRCPIFLKKENIDSWLAPGSFSLDQIDAMFDEKVDTIFENRVVA